MTQDDPAVRLIQMLTECGLRLSIAETTTGGLLSARLTAIPGSSKCFELGVVAYSRAAKHSLLGISDEAIKKHGSVSREIAVAMAEAVRGIGESEIGLAETGIAGPLRGRSPKPVGTCYIAIMLSETTVCDEHTFPGDREAIRTAICERALGRLIELLETYHPEGRVSAP